MPDKQRRGNSNGRRVLRVHSVLPDPLPYVFHGCPAPAQSSPGAGSHQTLRQVPHGRDTSRAAARRGHGHPPRHGLTASADTAPCRSSPTPTVHRPEAERILHAPRDRAQTTGWPAGRQVAPHRSIENGAQTATSKRARARDRALALFAVGAAALVRRRSLAAVEVPVLAAVAGLQGAAHGSVGRA